MDKSYTESPFRPLGRQLKALRDRQHETLAEASGAVEIDVKELAGYELGQTRPSEDILLLLISHFEARDDEAVRLWELAGYRSEASKNADGKNQAEQPDNRILFTDTVDIVINQYGVVMNFMQNPLNGIQPVSVARVGMSHEHAKTVLQILQIVMEQRDNTLPSSPNKLMPPADAGLESLQ